MSAITVEPEVPADLVFKEIIQQDPDTYLPVKKVYVVHRVVPL